MRRNRLSATLAAAVTLSFWAAPAHASVWLLLADDDATPTSAIVAPGGPFTLKVKVASSTTAAADQVAGVDYQLQQTVGPQSGVFTLTGRDMTTGAGTNPFDDPFFDNATVLAPAVAKLAPRSGKDLGASLRNIGSPVRNNTSPTFNPALVATYTLAVAATATPGAYTLGTYSPAGVGYSDAAFNDRTFSTATPPGTLATTFAVTVTYAGDADLSGTVNFNDLVALAQNYDADLTIATDPRSKLNSWTLGDFNFDKHVDFQDLVLLAQNYDRSVLPAAVPAASADFQSDVAAAFASVPEPGALALLFGPAAMLLRRRRRR